MLIVLRVTCAFACVLLAAVSLAQRPPLSVSVSGEAIRFRGASDVISVNASGQICPFSPDSNFLALQQAGYGYLVKLSDIPEVLSWVPPQRKANWLRDSKLFYYDRLREVGIYDPATGQRLASYQIPPVDGWIAQSELSTHTDWPFLSIEGNRVVTFSYAAHKFGSVYRMDPADRGLPATNRELYPFGISPKVLIGAKASGSESNQWWTFDSLTGEGWTALPHRGRSHPSVSQDSRQLVISSHDGVIKCESLAREGTIAQLRGYRHQHGCFRYPWYVFSELHPTAPRDVAIHRWNVETGQVTKIAELPPREPTRFVMWSTPAISPDGKWICWKEIQESGRLDVVMTRSDSPPPPPPADLQKQIDALEAKLEETRVEHGRRINELGEAIIKLKAKLKEALE